MRTKRMYAFVAALLFLGACSDVEEPALELSARGYSPPLDTLEADRFQRLHQELTINIVFVGYEAGSGDREVDVDDFLAELPREYRATNRIPRLYGIPSEVGVDFTYDYDVVFTDEAFEDDFFEYLGSIAEPAPVNPVQDAYNRQRANSREIDENVEIDAPSVERWLADHAGSKLGVDTGEYTVFFINWYGRDDFVHHVYTKMDEPDLDTGVLFGQFPSRKIIAWGGTTPDDEQSGLGSLHRIWFHDLSAGPEAWTANWNVDIGDLDGNGRTDYRMPPVWEYGNDDGYRPFDDLTGDLGKITRYVALDTLFTTSPLYDPALSPPRLPSSVQLDVNVYQADPGSDGTRYFNEDAIVAKLSALLPLLDVDIDIESIDFDQSIERVHDCFRLDDSCFGNRLFGFAFGDLFLYHNDRLLQYLDGDADYEIPVFAFNVPHDQLGPFLGFADDNWADGTQSFTFVWDSELLRQEFGYGFSLVTIHEVGHHVGLSHPHDGYDYESDTDFSASDDFFFVWAGDQSNTIMSYIELNWDFSQFDRDNMNRFMTATYLNGANAILADIIDSPRATRVEGRLQSADRSAAASLASYETMHYGDAAAAARDAYDEVLAAAAEIGVSVEPEAWQADYRAKKDVHPRFVEELDFDHIRFAR